MAYIEVKHESKRYKMGETIITANNDINFTADQGKLTVILGPSGAGKSTLLNILGGMDSPTEGEVWIDGTDIATFSDRQLTAFRRHNVGFVFQFYNLIPNLTTRENVELAGSIVKDALDPTTVLKQVGLGARLDNFPSQLSGGENNGWPLLGRWRKTRSCCFVMNQLVPWIIEPANKSCSCYRMPVVKIIKPS